MDKEKDIAYLFSRYCNQLSSPEEYDRLMELIKTGAQDAKLKALLEELYQEIEQQETQGHIPHTPEPKRQLKLWPRIAGIAAAASIIIAMGAGLWFYTTRHPGTTLSSRADAKELNDIAPGTNAATLTLANGKKIYINDAASGQLAEQHGVKISKTADGQIIYNVISSESSDESTYNTLQTSNGQQTKVRLQDGSRVTLNAASALTYPASFAGLKERRVKLKGEGYFAVFHNEKQPFRVESKGQIVEDIGTEFNINAYDDETAVRTTLVEGAARVFSLSSRATSLPSRGKRSDTETNSAQAVGPVTLKPNQQSILSANNQLTVQNVDIEKIIDWKNGDFNLNRVNFKEAMRKIARWYNVQLVYETDFPDNLESVAWLSRSNKLSAVLTALEKAGLAHFRIEGRTVYISK